MIVFIVGGHGAGKSTLIRHFLKGATEDWQIENRRANGYRAKNLYIVGDYNKKFRNGGVDGVRPLDRMQKLLAKEAKKGNVILEGIGQAGIAHYVLPLIKKHGGAVVHIETDEKLCYKGVHDRGHTLSMDGVKRGCIRARNIARLAETHEVKVVTCNRGNALRKTKELLK